MSQDGMLQYENDRMAHQPELEEASEVGQEQAAPVISPSAASSLLNAPLNPVQRRALVQNVGQNFGNKQVQRLLGTIRRSASSGPEGGPLEGDLSQVIQSERSKGTPLDGNVRRQVESSIGHDLSPVRVHTDSVSAELNRQMGAKAFTTGRDIFYGEGQLPSDLSLTTHEATHTVQQGFSETAPSSIGAADTAHEKAADHAAAHGSAGAGVQRQGAEEDEVAMKRDDAVQREGDEEELQMKRDDAVQRVGAEDEELQMKRDDTVQREGEDEELQMKRDDAVQREGEEEEALQG